jgi:hypothetical protein
VYCYPDWRSSARAALSLALASSISTSLAHSRAGASTYGGKRARLLSSFFRVEFDVVPDDGFFTENLHVLASQASKSSRITTSAVPPRFVGSVMY